MTAAPAPVEAGDGRPTELLVRIAWPSLPTCAAVLSNGSVGSLLVSGTVPSGSPLVWPLVVLSLATMAYDLGVRALGRAPR